MKKAIAFSSIFPLLLLIASCADSVPAIADAKLMTVFEFSAEGAHPSMFLFEMVYPTSNIDFADSLRLTHPASGFVWKSINPLELRDNNVVWICSPRLAPYNNEDGFAEGQYLAAYTDTSGRVSERAVQLAFPEGLKTATAQTAAALLPENAVTKIAVYDEDDNLLYYGERSDDMTANDEIHSRYPTAFSYRECISTSGNAVTVLLPPVYLFETGIDVD
jgi:hypothetical protein